MKVIVIGENNGAKVLAHKIDNSVIVLDKRYEPIEQKTNVFMSNIINMAKAFQGVTERQRPSVDLVQEFELIQKKQSKLSRSDRNWVVKEFNKRYKEIL